MINTEVRPQIRMMKYVPILMNNEMLISFLPQRKSGTYSSKLQLLRSSIFLSFIGNLNLSMTLLSFGHCLIVDKYFGNITTYAFGLLRPH